MSENVTGALFHKHKHALYCPYPEDLDLNGEIYRSAKSTSLLIEFHRCRNSTEKYDPTPVWDPETGEEVVPEEPVVCESE